MKNLFFLLLASCSILSCQSSDQHEIAFQNLTDKTSSSFGLPDANYRDISFSLSASRLKSLSSSGKLKATENKVIYEMIYPYKKTYILDLSQDHYLDILLHGKQVRIRKEK